MAQISVATAMTNAKSEFQITVSPHFNSWLHQQQISLAFTHPPQKLFFIGLQPDGSLSTFIHHFPHCVGMATGESEQLYVSTRYQLWRLAHTPEAVTATAGDFDCCFTPRQIYTTGALAIHDMAVEESGRVIFVNTRFGCLATISELYSFVPLWRPPHLAKLPEHAPGDRSHLNGLALRAGRAAYVTSVAQTARFDGWRAARKGGGVVIDVQTNQVVTRGLSMPHSPRWHRGRLWLTNAATGHFGHVDLAREQFEPVAFCPGFLRGLAFCGDYALIGASKPRAGDVYSGLGLDEELQRRKLKPHLGLFVVDLHSGEVVHWLALESPLREVYDVVVWPGVRQPMALGCTTAEIPQQVHYSNRVA